MSKKSGYQDSRERWHELAFLPGIPEEKKTQLVEALRRPEGTITFIGKYEGIFDRSKGRGILLNVVAGQTILRLERGENLDVDFIYSSPGTGTRIATVNIESLKDSSALRFFLVWSPDEIRLHIGSAEGKSELLNGYGKTAEYQLMVGKDGSVVQVGNKGVEVMGVHVASGGKTILESPAINTWHDTIKAIDILETGTSKEGYIFENVVSCMSLVILCTGFETYCKKRFIELVGEGMTPNYSNLEKTFFSTKEREANLMDEFLRDAKLRGDSLAQEIVDRRRIDFGNYDDCKDAFNKGYGVKFPEDLGIDSLVIQRVKEFIGYRHKIVHVSPLQSMLNFYEVPFKEPIFAKKETIQVAREVFSTFIEGLHKATLKLRP